MESNQVQYLDTHGDIRISANRLPHWEQEGGTYFVTFRTADSLPKKLFNEWQRQRDAWLNQHPKPWDAGTESVYYNRFIMPIERALDRGHGSCPFADPTNTGTMQEAFEHFDGERYSMISSVVMPNHVHAIVSGLEKQALKGVMQSWKGYTARVINKRMGKKGAFWQKDYFDRLIRDESHLYRCLRYIRNNPTKAGISKREGMLVESDLARTYS